jgi:branched-chain amino acid transport system substrate-binding protein
MDTGPEKSRNGEALTTGWVHKDVSRRHFLKLAGVTGAALGMGGGLSALSACGGESTTSSTTSATTSSSGVTATTGATPTTTNVSAAVTAGVEDGREIKIGVVGPITGALANMGIAAKYYIERWQEAVADGLICGDGKNHPISFNLADSQSDSNRAGQVAADLVLNSGAEIVLSASSNDTVNPVSDQCEALQVPNFNGDAPWEPWYFGRGATPDTPFKWTYLHFWGLGDIINVYFGMWDAVQTNKIVACMWPNDATGNGFGDAKMGFPAAMSKYGYTVVDPGRYTPGTEDYSSQISLFKKEGCEILTGVPDSGDFANFWKQCLQQGFKPKFATIAKGLDYPWGVEALGEGSANNFTLEMMWSPRHPFKSSLTGETCKQIADDFEKRTGRQWAGYLLQYGIFEVVADALKRCPNVDDKEEVIKAISTTKVDTLNGPVDFTAPVKDGTMHPVKNVVRSPLVGGQWKKGTDWGVQWKYEFVTVNNANYPDIAVDSEMTPMIYE